MACEDRGNHKKDRGNDGVDGRRGERRMYVLRVVTEEGVRKYAYGNEDMAFVKLRYFFSQPEVTRVTMEYITWEE